MDANRCAAHRRWRAAPPVDFTTLVGDGPILVLAPHPDDETIGCGGLIREAVRRGVPVAVDILTDGSRSHPSSPSFSRARVAALRREEAARALACLGLDRARLDAWDVEDSRLAVAEELVDRLRRRVDEVGASSVFVTWVGDPHCDHQAAFELAARAVRASAARPRLYAYPVWSWTIDVPPDEREGRVHRFDVAGDLALKHEALACHASQLGEVILDDPAGFTLTPAQIELFLQPWETFIEVDPDRG